MNHKSSVKYLISPPIANFVNFTHHWSTCRNQSQYHLPLPLHMVFHQADQPMMVEGSRKPFVPISQPWPWAMAQEHPRISLQPADTQEHGSFTRCRCEIRESWQGGIHDRSTFDLREITSFSRTIFLSNMPWTLVTDVSLGWLKIWHVNASSCSAVLDARVQVSPSCLKQRRINAFSVLCSMLHISWMNFL